MMINFINAFTDVANSFKEPMVPGKYQGHLYVVIDEKGEVKTSINKSDATSFKKITCFVDQVLKNQYISFEDKKELIKSYKLITHQFENKKINFLNWLFFGFLIKPFQVFLAHRVTNRIEKQLMVIKENFIVKLIDFKFITKEQTPKTLIDCSKLYKRLIIGIHPDKQGGDENRCQQLNAIWTTFKDEIEALLLGSKVSTLKKEREKARQIDNLEQKEIKTIAITYQLLEDLDSLFNQKRTMNDPLNQMRKELLILWDEYSALKKLFNQDERNNQAPILAIRE